MYHVCLQPYRAGGKSKITSSLFYGNHWIKFELVYITNDLPIFVSLGPLDRVLYCTPKIYGKSALPYFIMHDEIRKYWFSVYLGAPHKENGDFCISGPLKCHNVPFSVKRNDFRKKKLPVNGWLWRQKIKESIFWPFFTNFDHIWVAMMAPKVTTWDHSSVILSDGWAPFGDPWDPCLY
jgi:hypothetical protein